MGVSGAFYGAICFGDLDLRGSLGVSDAGEYYWFLLFYKGISLYTCFIYLILTPAFSVGNCSAFDLIKKKKTPHCQIFER